ncbi:MAG TPA: hypothetical protein VIL97_07310, partial [Thermoanaerobaculia bacterium]
MKRLATMLLLLTIACGGENVSSSTPLSKTPVSIRGWIAEIVPPSEIEQSIDPTMRAQQQLELLRETNMSVENVPYASGGLGETGSFVILDAPPGRVVVIFLVPGSTRESRLVLENIPPHADVLIPGIVLHPDRVELPDPGAARVRLASGAKERREVPSKVT